MWDLDGADEPAKKVDKKESHNCKQRKIQTNKNNKQIESNQTLQIDKYSYRSQSENMSTS